MNIPSFTAEASLYKTSGQYRTGRPAMNLRRQPNTINPAVMNEGNTGEVIGSEVINVTGTAPHCPLGQMMDSGGICSDPVEDGNISSNSSGLVVPDSGGGGSSGRSGPGPNQKKPSAPTLQGKHKCTDAELKGASFSAQLGCVTRDLGDFTWDAYCSPDDKWPFCCTGPGPTGYCDPGPYRRNCTGAELKGVGFSAQLECVTRDKNPFGGEWFVACSPNGKEAFCCNISNNTSCTPIKT